MKVIIDNHQIEFPLIDKIRYIESSNYIELSDYIGLSDYIELSDYRIIGPPSFEIGTQKGPNFL